jgi:hypothetical protein
MSDRRRPPPPRPPLPLKGPLISSFLWGRDSAITFFPSPGSEVIRANRLIHSFRFLRTSLIRSVRMLSFHAFPSVFLRTQYRVDGSHFESKPRDFISTSRPRYYMSRPSSSPSTVVFSLPFPLLFFGFSAGVAPPPKDDFNRRQREAS